MVHKDTVESFMCVLKKGHFLGHAARMILSHDKIIPSVRIGADGLAAALRRECIPVNLCGTAPSTGTPFVDEWQRWPIRDWRAWLGSLVLVFRTSAKLSVLQRKPHSLKLSHLGTIRTQPVDAASGGMLGCALINNWVLLYGFFFILTTMLGMLSSLGSRDLHCDS